MDFTPFFPHVSRTSSGGRASTTELMVDVKVLCESGRAEDGDSSPGSDAAVADGDGVSCGRERLLMRCMALRLGHSATSEVDTSWAMGLGLNMCI